MKTIAYVLANFPTLSETFIVTEIRAMQRLGHRVVPVVLGHTAVERQPDTADIAAVSIFFKDIPSKVVLPTALVRTLPGLPEALRFTRSQEHLPRRSLLWCGLKIAAWAHLHNCTHIHAHFAQAAAAHAIVAARLLRVPVTFVAHGHDVYQYPVDLAPKLRAADAAVAVCEDLRRDLLDVAGDARIVTIPCGVDPNRFRPDFSDEARASNGRLLFISRLVDGKGLDDAMKALAQLPREKRPPLDVVGAGPEQAAWEALARELGLTDSVSFFGPRSSDWIAQHGPNYLALIAPFKLGRDGFRDTGPVVVKEAMAMGLPVVTTRFSGVKEMIDESCGAMADPGDPTSLHAALEKFLQLDAAARAALGRAARQRLEDRYSDVAQARALSQLVESGA